MYPIGNRLCPLQVTALVQSANHLIFFLSSTSFFFFFSSVLCSFVPLTPHAVAILPFESQIMYVPDWEQVPCLSYSPSTIWSFKCFFFFFLLSSFFFSLLFFFFTYELSKQIRNNRNLTRTFSSSFFVLSFFYLLYFSFLTSFLLSSLCFSLLFSVLFFFVSSFFFTYELSK